MWSSVRYAPVLLLLVVGIQALKKCGRITIDENRIVFGRPAEKGANPWIISLELYLPREDAWEHQCAGTLLDKQWILTAAHCFKLTKDVTKWRLVAGQYDRSVAECSEQILEISTILTHPDYEPSGHRHDIALVLADGKFVTAGNYVKPVCFPDSSMVFSDQTPCRIAGWGQTMLTSATSDTTKLLYYNSTILNREECEREARRISEENSVTVGQVTEEMICIKSEFDRSKPYRERGSGGTCGGDSGGPLICQYDDHHYVAGIISWGLRRPCGYTHDVFTRLHVYLDWVKETRAAHKEAEAKRTKEQKDKDKAKRPKAPVGC